MGKYKVKVGNKEYECQCVDDNGTIGKAIDLSDMSAYPASVISNLKDDSSFALGYESRYEMLHFLKEELPKDEIIWEDTCYHKGTAEYEDFLFRALSAMFKGHRCRRDAMIASDGYRFIWENKSIEPVPGLMDGDKLCDILTRVRDRDMPDFVSINNYDDREERRMNMTYTYSDLWADLDKEKNEADFYALDLGCGMILFRGKGWRNRSLYVMNTELKTIYPLVNPHGVLIGFTHNDIDWESVNKLEHNGDAMDLVVRYAFGLGAYRDGVARFDWMLYPDGQYFADESGFGMEDNDEVNVSAYIDKECRVLVKFQDMEDPAVSRKLFEEAVRIEKGKKIEN